MSQLQLPGFAKPFFIQYRIEDVDDFETKAAFGASEGSSTPTSASRASPCASATTRPTAPAAAATAHSNSPRSTTIPSRCARRCGPATDQAYKNALAAYAQKQAALKQVQTPPQADDFSHEKPLISLAESAPSQARRSRVGERVAQRQRTLPHRCRRQSRPERRAVLAPRCFMRASPPPGWSIAKEPSCASRQRDYQEAFAVGTQAPDGMRLDRSYASHRRHAQGSGRARQHFKSTPPR